jgi:hypothetical protein
MDNSIKIIRLQTGEDIIATYVEDDESDTVVLNNPMHILFKRMMTGQTYMVMMPWLPMELIKENNALIYTEDILTVIEPKDDLIEYYHNVVDNSKLDEDDENYLREKLFSSVDSNIEGDEEEDDVFSSADDEELDSMLYKRKSNKFLH